MSHSVEHALLRWELLQPCPNWWAEGICLAASVAGYTALPCWEDALREVD